MTSHWRRHKNVPIKKLNGFVDPNAWFEPILYCDVNGKEWILFLCSRSESKSCIYDISQDSYKRFTTKNNKEFDFMVKYQNEPRPAKSSRLFHLDKENHLIHILWVFYQGLLFVTLDINDLNNVTQVNEKMIHRCENGPFPPFKSTQFKSILIEDDIHLIFSFLDSHHYVINVKSSQLSILNTDSNYYINQSNVPTKLVVRPVFAVGNEIDIRLGNDDFGEYCIGKIVDIKQCGQTVSERNVNIAAVTSINKLKDLFGLRVVTRNLFDSFGRGKWMYFDYDRLMNKQVCDCIGKCETSASLHVIANPRTQSKHEWKDKKVVLWNKPHDGYLIYSNVYQKMYAISPFNNIWGKYISTQIEARLIINGFVRRFELSDDVKRSKENIFIPKDLCNLIVKYYFVLFGDSWEVMEYDNIQTIDGLGKNGSVLLDDGKQVLMLGGTTRQQQLLQHKNNPIQLTSGAGHGSSSRLFLCDDIGNRELCKIKEFGVDPCYGNVESRIVYSCKTKTVYIVKQGMSLKNEWFLRCESKCLALL